MTREDKDLLIKDLSARLPYGVKVKLGDNPNIFDLEYRIKFAIMYGDSDKLEDILDITNIKPFLFPLSSMTEEQKKEISKRYNLHTSYGLCIEITNHSEGYWDDDNSCHLQDYLWLVDWFNKNHFDYRGLIPKGIAKDATGLNIY